MKSEPLPKCSKSGCVPLPGLRGALQETVRHYVKCSLLLLEVLIYCCTHIQFQHNMLEGKPEPIHFNTCQIPHTVISQPVCQLYKTVQGTSQSTEKFMSPTRKFTRFIQPSSASGSGQHMYCPERKEGKCSIQWLLMNLLSDYIVVLMSNLNYQPVCSNAD